MLTAYCHADIFLHFNAFLLARPICVVLWSRGLLLHDGGVPARCIFLPFMMVGSLQVVPLYPSCWWGPSRLHLSAPQQTDTILVDFPLAPLGPYVHNLHKKCGITHHTHKVFTNLHSHQPRVRNPLFLHSALIGISRLWSFCQSEGAK